MTEKWVYTSYSFHENCPNKYRFNLHMYIVHTFVEGKWYPFFYLGGKVFIYDKNLVALIFHKKVSQLINNITKP
jgi:hypothetical protein